MKLKPLSCRGAFFICNQIMSPTKVLLPACPFPPIPYMAFLMQMPGNCFVEQHETYPKQTYRNRFTIAGANGKLQLMLPVTKPNGNHTKTKDILISHHDMPFRKHIIALEAAYNSSPFFEFFIDDVVKLYEQSHNNLMDFNLASLNCVSNMLRHQFQFTLSSDFVQPHTVDKETIDLRYLLNPKNIHSQQFQFPKYYQVFQKNGFIGGLSILDLIFNTGKETLLYLQKFPLEDYTKTIDKTL